MIRKLDYKKVSKTIIRGIKKFVKDKNVIIGISGGIDSALTATLCTIALKKNKIFVLLLPYGNQQDIQDSLDLVNFLGIDYKIIDIKPIVDQYPNFGNKLVKANLMSRTRMTMLYAFANFKNALVIGTTNKSEMTIGYFTKFGDGGVDFEPIAEIYKTEVFEMAKILNIPQNIITKKPTAGLWNDQTDEDEMGLSYAQLDRFLQGESINKIVDNKIKKLIKNSEHKRHLSPTINI
jgi:NAD+ synthase